MTQAKNSATRPASGRRLRWMLALALISLASVLAMDQAAHHLAREQADEFLNDWQSSQTQLAGFQLVQVSYDRRSGEVDYRLRLDQDISQSFWNLLGHTAAATPLEIDGHARVITRGLRGLTGTLARVEGVKMVPGEVQGMLPDSPGPQGLSWSLDIDLSGDHLLSIEGQPYQGLLLDPEGMSAGEAVWSPWQGQIRWQDEQPHSLWFDWPRLKLHLTDRSRDLEIQEGRLELDYHQNTGQAPATANWILNAGQFRLADELQSIELRAFILGGHASPDADRLIGRVDHSFESLSVDGINLIERLELRLAGDLDRQALAGLLPLQQWLEPGRLDDPAARQLLDDTLTAMLRRGGVVDLEEFSLSQDPLGGLNLRLKLALDADPQFAAHDPAAWIQSVSAAGSLSSDAPLMQEGLRLFLRADEPELSERELDRKVRKRWRQWSFVLPLLPITTRWDAQGFELNMELESGAIHSNGRRIMGVDSLLRMLD